MVGIDFLDDLWSSCSVKDYKKAKSSTKCGISLLIVKLKISNLIIKITLYCVNDTTSWFLYWNNNNNHLIPTMKLQPMDVVLFIQCHFRHPFYVFWSQSLWLLFSLHLQWSMSKEQFEIVAKFKITPYFILLSLPNHIQVRFDVH